MVLLTYERFEYAEVTLRSTLENLKFSDPYSVHIADDGSSEEHRQKLYEIAGGYDHVQGVSVTNAERGGYGKSYNLASQQVHNFADLILPLEDDWEMKKELDVDALLPAFEHFGCIRLGYIGYTQNLQGEFINVGDTHYLHLLPDSAEPHVWAGHPRLETKGWQRNVGPWPEGLNAGATEFEVAQRKESRIGVAWPIDLTYPRGDIFHHIGSVQARNDQKEAVTT